MNDASHTMSVPSMSAAAGPPRPWWRRTGVVTGVVAMVIGAAAVGGGVAMAIGGVGEVVEGYERANASNGVVDLAEARRYLVFAEFPGAGEVGGRFAMPTITSPDGRLVELGSAGTSQSYVLGGRSGILVGVLDAEEAGTYDLSGGDPGVTFAFGTRSPIGSGGLLGILVAVVGGFVGFAGFVTLVVSVVRHRRDRRSPAFVAPGGPYAGPS